MAALSETHRNNPRINSSNLNSMALPTTPSFRSPCDDPRLFASSAVSVVVASCYAILIPVTLLGNGSVIAAFAANARLRTATNILILGLAASDLLVGAFAVPFWTFIVSHADITAGHCYSTYLIYISFDIFAGCASILQLTAIALERFLSTQWPLFHRKLPQYVYCIMLLVSWLCALTMAALQPLQAKTETWRKSYTVALFVSCCCSPLVIIVTSYCYIFKISRFQGRRRKTSSSKRCGLTPGGAIKELNVAITVAVITVLFVTAWFPFFVVTVIATFCLRCLPSPPALLHLVKFLKFLQYSSSAINPYIYAYRNAEMRKTLAKIARKLFPCDLGIGTRNVIDRGDSIQRYRQSIIQADQKPECYQTISRNNLSSAGEVFVQDTKSKPAKKSQKKNKKKTKVIYL